MPIINESRHYDCLYIPISNGLTRHGFEHKHVITMIKHKTKHDFKKTEINFS